MRERPRRAGGRNHGGAVGCDEGGDGRGAAAGLGRARALLPHRRDREALLHRGDPRRDHGHRQLPDAAVGQTVRVLPALHPRAGHARGGQGPRRKGGDVAAVRLRGTLHVHVAHAGRAPDLPALQLHPHGAVRRGQAAGAPGHPGGRAHQQLPRDRGQGQADGAAAPRAPAARPGGADPEGAELPEVPRGAVPHDEREHQPARALVVHRPDRHPHPHRPLADAAPQELLRGQETRLAPQNPLRGHPKIHSNLGGSPKPTPIPKDAPKSTPIPGRAPKLALTSEGTPKPTLIPEGAPKSTANPGMGDPTHLGVLGRDPQTHPTHFGVLGRVPHSLLAPQTHPRLPGRYPKPIPPTLGRSCGFWGALLAMEVAEKRHPQGGAPGRHGGALRVRRKCRWAGPQGRKCRWAGPPDRKCVRGGAKMAAEMEAKGFEHMGLDGRLLRAVAELGWAVPTAIQARAIPLAMEGRDLLARARTGSGKTGAYGLPVLHKLLSIKEASPAVPQAVRALVLVPSAELARQVGHTLRRLAAFCARQLRVAELCGHSDLAEQRPVLMEQPDIVVGTPGRVLAHVAGHSLALRPWLELLVLDEADLLLSFGFGDDIRALLCHMPKIYQALLVSATLNPELEALQELVLHNPVHVLPPEPRLPGSSQLQQFQLRCPTEEDKFLLLAALLKLRLLRGRALLFVGSLARAFRLKLFLEQFGIAACALNPQLPARSRCHVIAQFNRGLYDYIVATDEEGPAEPPRHRPRRAGTARKGDKKGDKEGDKEGDKKARPPQCPQDPEFGVSRGIDFQNVAAVINFDVPSSVETYIHRVGRTARGDSPGTALTLALPDELEGLRRIEDTLAAENGQSMLQPYEFRMEEIETLRYRCRDAMRAVTKQAVREARLRELRQELLNSEKLKVYFEDNPRDLQALRHDRPLHPANVQPHMGHVPEYLVPPSLRGIADPNPKKRKCPRGAAARRGGRKPRGSGNPLQSFRFTRRGNRRGAPGTP